MCAASISMDVNREKAKTVLLIDDSHDEYTAIDSCTRFCVPGIYSRRTAKNSGRVDCNFKTAARIVGHDAQTTHFLPHQLTHHLHRVRMSDPRSLTPALANHGPLWLTEFTHIVNIQSDQGAKLFSPARPRTPIRRRLKQLAPKRPPTAESRPEAPEPVT